jgi:hypothetical protein
LEAIVKAFSSTHDDLDKERKVIAMQGSQATGAD